MASGNGRNGEDATRCLAAGRGQGRAALCAAGHGAPAILLGVHAVVYPELSCAAMEGSLSLPDIAYGDVVCYVGSTPVGVLHVHELGYPDVLPARFLAATGDSYVGGGGPARWFLGILGGDAIDGGVHELGYPDVLPARILAATGDSYVGGGGPARWFWGILGGDAVDGGLPVLCYLGGGPALLLDGLAVGAPAVLCYACGGPVVLDGYWRGEATFVCGCTATFFLGRGAGGGQASAFGAPAGCLVGRGGGDLRVLSSDGGVPGGVHGIGIDRHPLAVAPGRGRGRGGVPIPASAQGGGRRGAAGVPVRVQASVARPRAMPAPTPQGEGKRARRREAQALAAYRAPDPAEDANAEVVQPPEDGDGVNQQSPEVVQLNGDATDLYEQMVAVYRSVQQKASARQRVKAAAAVNKNWSSVRERLRGLATEIQTLLRQFDGLGEQVQRVRADIRARGGHPVEAPLLLRDHPGSL